MRRDLPSAFQSKVLSSDSTLTSHDMMVYGLFVADTAGITVTLPEPSYAGNGMECMVINNAPGNVTVSCSNGFPNNRDAITLASGSSVMLYCAQVSGSSYRWSSVGATAA